MQNAEIEEIEHELWYFFYSQSDRFRYAALDCISGI
jgi:hypothetical protein